MLLATPYTSNINIWKKVVTYSEANTSHENSIIYDTKGENGLKITCFVVITVYS